jgi:hypothetical protein
MIHAPSRRRLLAAFAASAFAVAPAGAQTPPMAEPLIAHHAAHGGRALTILRNGIVRVESYAGPRTAPAPLGEASSALCTALAAAMAADRMLELGEPAALTLSEFSTSPLKSGTLVRHLLARTCGIPAAAAGSTAAALAAEPITPPGQVFDPTDAGLVLFAELARRKLAARGLEGDPAYYLQRRVLDPIGAVDVTFERGVEGLARLGDGAEASGPALAAFGELIRRGGIWRARWLIDPETVSECAVTNGVSSRAGLGWWLGAGPPLSPDDPLRAVSDLWQFGPGLPTDLMMAAGHGGQRLYILPTRRIVAARLGDPVAGASWSDAAFLRHLLATL